MSADYLEIKRHKNKPAQHFLCTLLQLQTGYAVLRYSSEDPGQIADIHIVPGSTTIAHYWVDRPYVAWRMFDCNADLLGTLFHICDDVRIFDDHLSYEDLLLDVWVAPDGTARILDEDEVHACADEGLISETELLLIRASRDHIVAWHADIIADLAEFDHSAQKDVVPSR